MEDLQHNFLFIRIPKTASTSICQALGIWSNHKTAEQWRKKIGTEFDRVYKFTIVRNPYERFRSLCRFLKITEPEKFQQHPNARLFIPQVDYLYIRGKLQVDYIGRFEDLENSFKKICKVIGTQYTLLPHKKKNEGDKLPLEAVKDIVNRYYRQDFKLLGY